MFPEFLCQKIGNKNPKLFFERLGFIPDNNYYECLIDILRAYSSLANLEDSLLQQTGCTLPSKKIIQEYINEKIS